MPTSLKSVIWWALAILFFVWLFKVPGAAHSIATLFSSLMSAIVGVVTEILKAITGIIPGA
jgi:hypothetical protein